MPTTVTVFPNGPIKIAGDFVLTGADGNVVTPTPAQVALCRCGHSAKKPYCDGSHRAAGFIDPAPKA